MVTISKLDYEGIADTLYDTQLTLIEGIQKIMGTDFPVDQNAINHARRHLFVVCNIVECPQCGTWVETDTEVEVKNVSEFKEVCILSPHNCPKIIPLNSNEVQLQSVRNETAPDSTVKTG